MKDQFKLHILGGGPAGIASGYYANKKGMSFKIYESSDSVGGNCKTISDGQFKFDTGAHRFHDKYDEITLEIQNLMGEQLKKVEAPSQIYYQGRMIDFPLNISSIMTNLDKRTILKIIIENINNMITKNSHDTNFKSLAYNNYGKTLSELFLINYTEKLWGSPADRLDARISGNRLKHLSLSSLLRQLLFHSNNAKHLDGSFYYPEYGFGTIFEKIIGTFDDNCIQYNSPIKKIIHENKKIIKIIYRDQEVASVDRVISTLPIHVLIKALEPSPPKQIIDILNSIQFRNLYLCVVYLDRPKFSDNASIYYPESIYPFTRIYEPKNRSKKMAPKDKTCIVVEIPYDQESELPLTPKEIIFKQTSDLLLDNGLIKKEDIINHRFIDLQYAYPVLHTGTQYKINNIFSYLSNFKNLYTIGRNAQFQYIHTHNIFKNARSLINEIS